MSAMRDALRVGWQSRRAAIALVVGAGLALTITVFVVLGVMPGVIALLSCALGSMSWLQWAVLDGPVLQLRDARTGFVDRPIPAREIVQLRFKPSSLPWCRLQLARGADGLVLMLHGPAPNDPQLRAVTLWLIVHGRRRVRIDAGLLDALAGLPARRKPRQPHDASPA